MAAAPIDVLVLTALKEELDALLQVKSGVSQRWTESGDILNVAVLEGRKGPIRIAAARLTRMGGVDAAFVAERLVEAARPRSLAMCGVCAGHPTDTELGDVIIADRVFQHDNGKSRAGSFDGDLWIHSSCDEWLYVAQELAGPAQGVELYAPAKGDDWKWWFLGRLAEGHDPLHLSGLRRYIPDDRREELLLLLQRERLVRLQGRRFTLLKAGTNALAQHQALHGTLVTRHPFHIHVGPIGSGNAVVSDGKVWGRLVKGGARKVLGIEMEAAAIGRVAHGWNLPFAVVKGVMDHADRHKSDRYKTFSARTAAEVLCTLLRKVIHPATTSSSSAHHEAPLEGAASVFPTETQALSTSAEVPGAAATPASVSPATHAPSAAAPSRTPNTTSESGVDAQTPAITARAPLGAIATALTSASPTARTPSERAPTCFIAYSSDTAEIVFPLVERLRNEGIDACFDRHVAEPPEGWFGWTRRQLVHADFVLVICSAAFRQRFEAAGAAAGTMEGLIAAQLGFTGNAPSGRWIPVLLAGARVDDVPAVLRTSTLYQLPPQHDELRRRIAPGTGRDALPTLPIVSTGAPAELRGTSATRVEEAPRELRTALRTLTEFLTARFEPDELRRLAFFHGGPELDASLPGAVASKAYLAHELVLKLWQRGQIDSDLFADLLRLRKAFANLFPQLCEAFGVVPPTRAAWVMPQVPRDPVVQIALPHGDDERAWTDEERLALEELLLPVLRGASKLSAALDLRLKEIPPLGPPVADLPLRVTRRALALGRGLDAAQRLAEECCEIVHGDRAVAADERSAARELMLKWLPRAYGGGRVYLLSAQPLRTRVPPGSMSLNLDMETVSPIIAEVHVAHLNNRHARLKTRAVVLDGRRQEIIEGCFSSAGMGHAPAW